MISQPLSNTDACYLPNDLDMFYKVVSSSHLILYSGGNAFIINFNDRVDEQPFFRAVIISNKHLVRDVLSEVDPCITYQDDGLVQAFITYPVTCDDALPKEFFQPVAAYFSKMFLQKETEEQGQQLVSDIFEGRTQDNQDALCRHWVLMLLIDGQVIDQFLKPYATSNKPLSKFLGIDTHPIDSEYNISALSERLTEERTQSQLPDVYPTQWVKSLYALADVYPLSPVDISIMIFCYLCDQHKHLKSTLTLLADMNLTQHIKLLAHLLSLSEADIQQALSHDGLLVRLRLLEINLSGVRSVHERVSLWSKTRFHQWHHPTFDAYQWFSDLQTQIIPRQPHPLSAYPYWQNAIEQIHPLLKTPKLGINILISAKSGMGKTALIHSLIAHYGLNAYQINVMDQEGQANTHLEQLKHYHQLQTLPNKIPNVCYVFDHQYVFWQQDGIMKKSYVDSYIDLLSTLLTHNTMPCFWLVEDASDIEPSLLNKMTCIIALPELHYQDKYTLIDQMTEHRLNPVWVARIAQHPDMTPAMMIADAFALTQLHETAIEDQQHPHHLHYLQQINQRLRLAKKPALTLSWKEQDYDLGYLNTDMPLSVIVQQLTITPQVRLCLYGPPGTGKTGFAKYLSQHLNLPLHVKKASDMLNAYIGESEKAIAQAFLQAQQQQAILLIDEIEGLIAKRDNSRYQWEVTQINEMLVQMENFSGIFIATTNHIQSFDSAALRRFDLKIKTDYLNSEQVIKIATETLQDLSLPALNTEQMQRVARMTQLTPSDFMQIRRGHHFLPIETTAVALSRLDELLALKEDGKKMGFVH